MKMLIWIVRYAQALQRVQPNLATEPSQPPKNPANAKLSAAAAVPKNEQEGTVQVPGKESAAVPGTDKLENPIELQPESKDGLAADLQLEAKAADQGGAGIEAALPENAGVVCAASLAMHPVMIRPAVEWCFSVHFSSKVKMCTSIQGNPWRLMGERR